MITYKMFIPRYSQHCLSLGECNGWLWNPADDSTLSYQETLRERSAPLSQLVTHRSTHISMCEWADLSYCHTSSGFDSIVPPHWRLERGHLSARYLPPRIGSREEEAIPDRDTYYLSLHLLNSPRHV